MEDCLNIVVTGEVDSGKSTLIGRFLYEIGSLVQGAVEEIGKISQKLERNFEFAYLLDTFEEERRNQLTIDTTQIFCKTKRGKELVFIDVPGHQELIKNMLCGSSYADIAILVVDVQKSVEPQTKRHAFILKFLGIEQIIVVLNKMDLVGFNAMSFKKVKQEIAELFVRIQLKPKDFIPVSAKQGENLIKAPRQMSWYKGLSVLGALQICCNKKTNGDFRFPIQDIYEINKEKLVVGNVISGNIKKGAKVHILPLNRQCKVKSIKFFSKKIFKARAPQSVGLIFEDMDGLRRGQVVCKSKLPTVNKEFLVKIFCVRDLSIKESLKFKCATQETACQIKQINWLWDTASLEPKSKEEIPREADIAEAVIVTENPVVVEKFEGSNSLGRFVLQNNKEICAVGIIL